jgi:hypothetical protein
MTSNNDDGCGAAVGCIVVFFIAAFLYLRMGVISGETVIFSGESKVKNRVRVVKN